MALIRLQKVIAQAGVASRRAAEQLIREGRVSVNGKIVTEMGTQVDPMRDDIRVDKKAIAREEPKLYIAFYKPRDCVTTLRDPQGRETIFSYLPKLNVRVFPVGRLDYDAEGLLVLTNDGALAHRLQHPRYGVPKIYEVKVKGHPDQRALELLRSGVVLEEGKTAPAVVSVVRALAGGTWLRVVLHQGWNRQLKRMGEAVGHPVLKIKRTGYGPLRLGELAPGKHRHLSGRELKQLYHMVHLDEEITKGNERTRAKT